MDYPIALAPKESDNLKQYINYIYIFIAPKDSASHVYVGVI